uniref:Uncharacterized protein n=1 Tax=Chaetoceros debilis TaxID=122233 RepID=A0A6S8TYN3_9STRA
MVENQFRVLAGQLRSKVDEALTTIKNKNSSTPLDPDDENNRYIHRNGSGISGIGGKLNSMLAGVAGCDNSNVIANQVSGITPNSSGTGSRSGSGSGDPNTSCSPEAVHPDDNDNHNDHNNGRAGAADIIDSVMSTLFGVCTGSNFTHCPNVGADGQDNVERLENMMHKKRMGMGGNGGFSSRNETASRLGTKASRALNSLTQRTKNISPSSKDAAGLSKSDEAFYAQFYGDDHGRAARVVLLARKREERERYHHRQQMENLHRSPRTGSQSHGQTSRGERRGAEGAGTASKRRSQPQHKENITTNGHGYRISEVSNLNRSSDDAESTGGVSYNYDDGISALSAHTLEEMAKVEKILQRRRGIPKEQGFELDLADSNDVDGDAGVGDVQKDDLPPSSSTRSNASESVDVPTACIQDVVNGHINGQGHANTNYHHQHHHLEESLEKYPVQMARPRISATGSGGAGTGTCTGAGANNKKLSLSTPSHGPVSVSSSSSSVKWQTQEKKYWMQVVENDKTNTSVGRSTSTTTASATQESSEASKQKSKQLLSHPHDTLTTSLLSKNSHPASSKSTHKKKRNKPRTKKLFGRRKKYMECEEEVDGEYEI